MVSSWVAAKAGMPSRADQHLLQRRLVPQPANLH
jgi:hypothetical protein